MSDARAKFLETSARIGFRLCRDAVWHEGRCNWLGWGMEPHGGQWVNARRSMGSLLYDGSAGIGLFLARLANAIKEPIVAETAAGALAQSLTAVENLTASGEYGFYSGLAGVAKSCVDGGVALGRDDVVARGRKAMDQCAALEPRSQRVDIINGGAGAIPALLDAADQFGDEKFVDAAKRHGEALLDYATRGDKGWSWDTLGMENEPHLLGFAHGASGIAYALAMLGSATGRKELHDAACEGLRYERAFFRESEGNWPDLRSFAQPAQGGQSPCMVAWCHGAPGVGFARVMLHKCMPEDQAILAEAETALRTTAATLGQNAMGTGNFSFCHGDGGNADLLLFAADELHRPQLRQQAEDATTRALQRYEDTRTPWPCGVPGAGEAPNLLLGLAGVGYFLLRLFDSMSTPTILVPSCTIRLSGAILH